MQKPSARERLRQLAIQTMPPGPYACILCKKPPNWMGVGRVDGRDWGYPICENCVRKPDYVARVVRHIRNESCAGAVTRRALYGTRARAAADGCAASHMTWGNATVGSSHPHHVTLADRDFSLLSACQPNTTRAARLTIPACERGVLSCNSLARTICAGASRLRPSPWASAS